MEFTVDQIKNMTDEEVSELTKKLGKRAMKRYALFMLIKWGLIFGAIHVVKKAIEDIDKNTTESK